MKILISILFLALCLISCESETLISPSGEITSEYRVITDFEKLEVNNGIDVIWVHSNKPTLLIESNANILPNIESNLTNGKLHIKRKNGISFSTKPKITAYLYCKSIKDITLTGNSNFSLLNKFELERLHLNISDEGIFNGEILCNELVAFLNYKANLQITGRSESFTIFSTGASKASDYGFETEYFNCDMREGSTAELTINKEIQATLNRSSILYYAGNPKITYQNLNDGSLIIKTK